MIHQSSLPSEHTKPSRGPAQTARLAWFVLGTAMACFLILCTLFGYGLWRLRASILRPLQGSHLVTYDASPVFHIRAGETQNIEVPANYSLPLGEGETVRVGESAPPGVDALLTLADGSTLQLYAGTRVTMTRLQATPYSDQFQEVVLELAAGQVSLGVAPLTGQYKQSRFTVLLPGARVELEPGDYLLRVGRVTEVAVREGQARVVSTAAPSTALLTPGQKTTVQSGVLRVEPAAWQLLQNGDFSQQEDGQLKSWTFRADNYGGGGLNATYRLIQEPVGDQVAQVIELERKGSLVDTGAAILSQDLREDVSPYRSVRLDLDVNLKRQMPPGGGPSGENYPFAVRIWYQDGDGLSRQYTYGFYYYTSADNKTVLADGEAKAIAHDAWVPQSLELLDMPVRPVLLTKVELLGSGQDFRSWVAHVSLTTALVNP